MINKKKLEQELLQYLNYVIELRNTFLLYKKIKSDKNSSLEKVNKYPYLFVTIINALEYSFIMQSYKIFDDTEDKNIFTLIKLCRNNQKHFFNKNEILKTLDELELYLSTKKLIIENIRSLRNKFFAHTDRKYFAVPDQVLKDFSIKNEELEFLIQDTFKYVKKMYSLLQPFMLVDWAEHIDNDWNNIISNL